MRPSLEVCSTKTYFLYLKSSKPHLSDVVIKNPETQTTLGTRQQDNTKHRKLKWWAIPTYQIRKITMTGRFFFFKTLVWEKTIFDTRYILAYACLLTYRHNVPNCQANLFCTYWRNLKCRLQTGYGYIEDRHVCYSCRYAHIVYINK